MKHDQEPFRQASPLLLTQTNSVQVEPESSELNSAIQSPVPLLLLGMVVLGLFLLQVLGDLRAAKQKVIVHRSPNVPCYRCRFFSNNVHLKCAVRPSDVLTKRAVNCSDYASFADAAKSCQD